MTIEDDFEERLNTAFSESERVTVPPLSPERMTVLRTLVRHGREDQRSLSLLWRKVADAQEKCWKWFGRWG